MDDAAENWPDGQQRDKGLCLARLADLQSSIGDVSAACAIAREAADLYSVAPSARTAQSLRSLRNRLHTHRRSPEVASLRARLADVV
jgi:hypothetical protein